MRASKRHRWRLCVALLFVGLVSPVHGWGAAPLWAAALMGVVYLAGAWIATAGLSLARGLGLRAVILVVPTLAGAGLLHLRHQTDYVRVASGPVRALLLWMLLASALSLLVLIVPTARARWRIAVTALAGAATALAAVGVLYVATPGSRWFLMRNRGLGAVASALLQPRRESVDAYLAHTGLQQADSVPRFEADEVPPGRLPNVVFVLLDTFRADSLTALGGTHGSMPRLDALADEAFLFTDVWTNATWTRPSMAAWFTGMVPEAVGVRDENDRLPDGAWTLAEMLRSRGYTTVGFSTNAHVSEATGFDQGFDEFRRLRGDSYAPADDVRRTVESWLQAAALDRPVFMYVHLMDAHTPYKSGVGQEPWLPAHNVAGYRADLRFLDEQLAELAAALRDELGADTWLVLGADHGESFGDRGVSDHGYSLYLDEAWVPVIVLGPGAGVGKSGARLETRDFYRLFDLVARPTPPDLRAWAGSVDRKTRYLASYKTPTSALIRLLFPYRIVRLQGFQRGNVLTIRSDFGPVWETYDLERDPGQRRPHWSASATDLARVWGAMNDAVGAYSTGEPAVLSDEEQRRLKALGYIR